MRFPFLEQTPFPLAAEHVGKGSREKVKLLVQVPYLFFPFLKIGGDCFTILH